MSEAERFKRPELPRTTPIRHFRDVPPARAAGVTEPDPVGSGVGLGYRVISEYVRRGQEAARSFSGGAFSGAGLPSGADPQKLASRMVQYGSDLMAAWLEFVELTVKNVNPAAPAPPAQPRPFTDLEPAPANDSNAARAASAEWHGGEHRAHAERERQAPVGVRLTTSCKATVRLDLRGSLTGRRLIVHDLRAADPDKPRIAGAAFEEGGAGWLLHVAVPKDQPAGVYNAMIVDTDTSLPAGTVSVVVEG